MRSLTCLDYSISILALLLGPTAKVLSQDSTRVKQAHVHENRQRSQPRDTVNSDQLKQFRKAFNKVVNKKKIKQKKSAPQDPVLDIGGIIIDQTRTSFGRQFYNLFYQQWNPPESADSFNVTINEKPTPGLGSIVSISIDYQVVYRARLQPRNSSIKAASQQAIVQCLQIVQQKAKVRKQLSGY